MAKISSAPQEDFTTALVEKISASRKYRGLNIPSETVANLVEEAEKKTADRDEIEKIVRQKLHNLVAPYLGDPDYPSFSVRFSQNENNNEEIKRICIEVLRAHASTRERLPILNEFYHSLFNLTGVPSTILDVACGLNPFSLPWMNLPPRTRYLAYDLHQPRVDLINTFFRTVGQTGEAIHQDILINPPGETVDVVFFFKEAHRFDQRKRGCNRTFFQSLNTRWLLVSLPTVSLTGRHSKLDQNRKLIEEAIKSTTWQVTEILFENEIVFAIEKPL